MQAKQFQIIVLRLTVLGSSSLLVRSDDATEPTTFSSGKPLALVIYLACAPGRSVPRPHLLDLLWSDFNREEAQHGLRQAMWYLARRSGTRVITATHDRVSLAMNVLSDRDAFLEAVEGGDMRRAIASYGGDFLPEFSIPGSNEFDRWADEERSRLRRFFVRCAEAESRSHLAAARYREAQALARRVRDTDSLSQGSWRLYLETLVSSGDLVSAIAEADGLEEMLRNEGLDAEPSTRSLLRLIRKLPDLEQQPSSASIVVADMVGRESQFTALLDAWTKARNGKQQHVKVEAPAGFGKTRLLDALRHRLRASRADVIYTRCMIGARSVPLALAGDLVGKLATCSGARGISPQSASVLVALNPALSSWFNGRPDGAVADEALRKRTHAIRELVAVITEDHPLAILIDDVMWSDEASRELLGAVFAGLDEHRFLLVTSSRSPSRGLPTGIQGSPINLAPLSVEDISLLLASIAQLPAEPWTDALPAALYAATGGSPLLVIETLHLALERGTLVRSADAWQAPSPSALLSSLDGGSAIRSRIERLSQPMQQAMLLLGIAATPFAGDLIRACTSDLPDFDHLLVELEIRGFVLRTDESWQLSHDEVRAAVMEIASDADVTAAHSLVGRAILATATNDVMRRLAAFHLYHARHHEVLNGVIASVVRTARRSGDLRTARSIVAETMSTTATAAEIDRLVRSLPIRTRLPFVPRALGLAAVVAGVVVLVPSSENRVAGPPDAILMVATSASDERSRVYRVPVRREEWSIGEPLAVDLRQKPDAEVPLFLEGAGSFDIGPRPGTDHWTTSFVADDSGDVDVYDVGVGHGRTRLTFSRGPDYGASYSPDGRYLVFTTARWSRPGFVDIAILDRSSNTVRPLLDRPESEDDAHWSPDGSRIAFRRRHVNASKVDLCVVTVDGQRLHCLSQGLPIEFNIERWADPEHVLVAVGHTEGIGRLLKVSVRDGNIAVLNTGWRRGSVSADGQWAVCQCATPGQPQNSWLVFPVHRPEAVRPLALQGLAGRAVSMVWAPSLPTTHIASLRIDATSVVATGTPHALRVIAFDLRGAPTMVGDVSWSSLDTTIATVDSSGVVRGKRAGRVKMRASAGGWRDTTITLEVNEAVSHVVYDEQWQSTTLTNWGGYGNPRPAREIDADGNSAMRIMSTGSIPGGLYLAPPIPLGAAAVEVTFSTTVPAPGNQALWIGLLGFPDSAALARWNGVGFPRPEGHRTPECLFGIPGRLFDQVFGDSVFVHAAQRFTYTAPDDLRSGSMHQVRLQILPDGRCGIALDGRSLVTKFMEVTTAPAIPLRLFIYGSTEQSTILINRVRVWSGIPPGVVWHQ